MDRWTSGSSLVANAIMSGGVECFATSLSQDARSVGFAMIQLLMRMSLGLAPFSVALVAALSNQQSPKEEWHQPALTAVTMEFTRNAIQNQLNPPDVEVDLSQTLARSDPGGGITLMLVAVVSLEN